MYGVFVYEFYTSWRCYSIASGSLFSENSRESFSWDLILGLRFYVNYSSDSRGGGGGVLPYKSERGVRRNVSGTPLNISKRYQFNNNKSLFQLELRILIVIMITFEQLQAQAAQAHCVSLKWPSI